jgi:GNAT superfamily N-acetyltransferase
MPKARKILANIRIRRLAPDDQPLVDAGFLALGPTGVDVGAVWLRMSPEGEAGYGYVAPDTPELSLAVRPEHRGRGIGSALLDRMLQHADTHYAAVCLSVSSSNPALRLYERAGFSVVRSDRGTLTMLRQPHS